MNRMPEQIVIHLASDLMLGSTIRGLAEASRMAFMSARSADEVTVPETSSVLLLIDLNCPGLDLAQLCAELSDDVLKNVVAYGPHVHEDLLQTATSLGIGQVMARGQFSASVGRLVSQFAQS